MDRPDWLKRWFAVLLAGILFGITLDTDSVAPAASLVIHQALFITFSCYLLLPEATSTARLFVNSLAAIPLVIILSQLSTPGAVPLQVLFHVSIITLCLSLLLWSMSQLLAPVITSKQQLRKLIFISSVVFISAPVWLGPLTDIYQPGDSTTNTIIAIMPLTHFSVAAGFDYLRSEWFYQNTPFGSLPFSYPGLVSITVAYVVLFLSIQIVRWWLTRHLAGLMPAQKHSLTLS